MGPCYMTDVIYYILYNVCIYMYYIYVYMYIYTYINVSMINYISIRPYWEDLALMASLYAGHARAMGKLARSLFEEVGELSHGVYF